MDGPSDSEHTRKRARRSTSPAQSQDANTNGNGNGLPPDDLPPLSLSILGVEPLDEFVREIADFIHYHILNRPPEPNAHVEVEAKIGVLRESAPGGQRLQLPVLVETILAPNSMDFRFESNMSAKQHRHFNTRLNELKTGPPTSSSPLEYEHLYLVDSFYPSERGGERVRVTRDEKTSTVRACVRKVRLGDLNIYCPKRAVDWRVSVNLEIAVPPPIGTATHTRRKDRMSYTHEEFVIDLTQVTASSPGKHEVLHELELEIARPEYLLATAAKRANPAASERERGAFDELIRAFVNNTRILVRNADPDKL